MKKSKILNSKTFTIFRNSKFEIRNFFTRGISLVEVIIGTALILLSLTGLTAAYSFYLKAGLKNMDALKATFLLQEGVEVATLLRDTGWSSFASLTSGTRYHLSWNGSTRVATTTSVLVDAMFTRTILLDDVYRRNSDKDIVASTSPDAKSVDASTKRLTVRVTASSTPALDKSITTYLINLFE